MHPTVFVLSSCDKLIFVLLIQNTSTEHNKTDNRVNKTDLRININLVFRYKLNSLSTSKEVP